MGGSWSNKRNIRRRHSYHEQLNTIHHLLTIITLLSLSLWMQQPQPPQGYFPPYYYVRDFFIKKNWEKGISLN